MQRLSANTTEPVNSSSFRTSTLSPAHLNRGSYLNGENISSSSHTQGNTIPAPVPPHKAADPLHGFSILVPSLCLKPLSATEVVKKIQTACNDMQSKYLPCVDFLVTCQQDLRAGVQKATQKRSGSRYSARESMTTQQFYKKYLENLPTNFQRQYQDVMPSKHLMEAKKQINDLLVEAKRNDYLGCESMKNTFLGGMRDGESWGLRRWLSKNGGALNICNDMELIFQALQKLNRDEETTKSLASAIRPIALNAFNQLKSHVPQAYQAVSSAHPYLPFFHRMESALSGLKNFDPEDDDVICIDDDDEIEVVKNNFEKKAVNESRTSDTSGIGRNYAVGPLKRNVDSARSIQQPSWKRKRIGFDDDGYEKKNDHQHKRNESFRNNISTTDEVDEDSDSDSEIEVLCVKKAEPQDAQAPLNNFSQGNPFASMLPPRSVTSFPSQTENEADGCWICPLCTVENDADQQTCLYCGSDDELDLGSITREAIDTFEDNATHSASGGRNGLNTSKPSNGQLDSNEMAEKIDMLALQCEQGIVTNRSNRNFFWNTDGNYGYILRILSLFLREPSAQWFVNPVDEKRLLEMGKANYRSIIVNPLCLRDICDAIFKSYNTKNGVRVCKVASLSKTSLSWDMWSGSELLQAIDLAFLNALAYNGKNRTQVRLDALALRKRLWMRIQDKAGRGGKQYVPTRRGETSGFVVHKGNQY